MVDLMAGVAVTFLLLAAIFMVQVARATKKEAAAGRAAQKKLERITNTDQLAISALVELRDSLRDDRQLRGVVELLYDEARDPFLLTIVLDRDRLRFDQGDCALREAARQAMRSSFGTVFGRVCATAASGFLQSITLEGHTDNRPFFPADRRCGVEPARKSHCHETSAEPACKALGFANNVRLSAARAQNVFFETRQLLADDPVVLSCLETKFVVAGRGPVEPVDGGDWRLSRSEVKNERNRRVVIKVHAIARSVITAPAGP